MSHHLPFLLVIMVSSTMATINLEDIDLAAIQANPFILDKMYPKSFLEEKTLYGDIVQDRLISPVGMVNQFALQAEVTGIGALGWVTIGDLNLPKNIFNPGWVVHVQLS